MAFIMFKRLVLLAIIGQVFSANILYIAPVASPSHHLWNRQITLELVKNGHNITMLTHDLETKPMAKNWTIIHMEGVYEKLSNSFDYMALAEQQAKNSFLDATIIYNWVYGIAKMDMETKGLEQLLTYPEDYKFDLIIIDILVSPYLYPLIDRFHRPPVIAVSPILIHQIMTPSFGGHHYSSYQPHFVTPYTDKMSFIQRLYNMVFIQFDQFYRRHVFLKHCETMARQRFGDKYVRPLEEYEAEFALLLSNHDPLQEYPVALPPNIIQVGGLHAKPGKKLPSDLQEILDKSKDGVILFSLGTNMKSKSLKDDLRKKMIEGLGRLKQTVIWKYEEDISGLPKNIITRKWLPQNDMMAHPNLKLFITHGGALSTQEAMYHGVPVIGIPFFGDQIFNIRKMVAKGFGQMVLILELTPDSLFKAVTEVLENPRYAYTCKRLSQLLKEKPSSSLETAIYWIETTIKYGRIEEFRLATYDMTIIEIYNLDILAVLIFIIFIIILLFVQIIRKCFGSDPKTKFKSH